MATRSVLQQAIAQTALESLTDSGSLVVIRGEAGIGKTTLVQAATASVASDLRVIWSWCEPLTASAPLLPLDDLAEALGITPSGRDQHDRHDRFRTVLDAITSEPTVAVIEDIQWADDATLDLILYLGRRLPRRAACLVLTHRDDDPTANPRVGEVLTHLASTSHTFVVPPLDLDEISSIVEEVSIDPATALHITGGNAFFASELAKSGGRTPLSVREAVASRLSVLPAQARSALELLSVMPDGGSVDLICAAAQVDTDALEPAERARLIDTDGSQVTFRHDLARDAIASGLPGSRRRRLHEALLAAYLDRPNTPEAVLAFHADGAGDHSRAVQHGVRAAEVSTRDQAHAQAVVQLERAAGHAGDVTPIDAADVYGRLGHALARVGRTEPAIDAARESRDRWHQAGDLSGEAQQVAHLSRLHWIRGEVSTSHDLEREALRFAAQAPGSAGHLEAVTNSAISRMLDRNLAAAMAAADEAIALARREGDTVNEGRALNALGSAAILSGDLDRGRSSLREAVALGQRSGDEQLTSVALVNLGSASGEMRHYAVARDDLIECVEWCSDRDLDATERYAVTWLARIDFETGRWEQAESVAALLDDPSPVVRIGASTVIARVAVRRNNPEATDLLARARAEADPTHSLQRLWPVVAGECEARWRAQGDAPAGLEQLFDDAVGAEHPWAVGELGWWLVRFDLIRASDDRLRIAAAPFAAAIRGDFANAAESWGSLGCPYEQALANGETREHDRLADGIRELDRLGARSDADVLAARLRSLGGRTRRARRATASLPAGLTAREMEVLEVLRSGATDAEIATQLHISTKTAGHHVSSILGKLGVDSRREAAAWDGGAQT